MIRVELARQIRRIRTYVCVGALAIIPAIVALANRLDPGRTTNDSVDTFYIVSTASGLNHTIAALAFMSPFFLMVVVATFAGDAIAGEASWGTLRYLLVRPVSRGRLLAAKLFVAALCALGSTVVLALSGVISGTIAFGWKPVSFPFFEPIPLSEAVPDTILAVGYIALCMGAVVALAFFLSTLTDSPAGAIGGAIGLMVVSQILDTIDSLRFLHPGLPTHYWTAWYRLFDPFSVTSGNLGKGAVSALVWSVLLIAAATWRFRAKDVLS